jgi:nickel-dependent lactate racemase
MGRSEFEISYGDTNLHFSIPREAFYYYVKPRWIPEYQRDLECIAHALCHPIGAPPLADMVSPGMRIMILSDDNTRPTPKKQIIPMLLDELKKAGIKQGAIDVLIALGTHRYMTEIEIQETGKTKKTKKISIAIALKLERNNTLRLRNSPHPPFWYLRSERMNNILSTFMIIRTTYEREEAYPMFRYR